MALKTDFFVVRDGDRYVIVNAENGNEITRLYSSSVGQFKHANEAVGRVSGWQQNCHL